MGGSGGKQFLKEKWHEEAEGKLGKDGVRRAQRKQHLPVWKVKGRGNGKQTFL